MRIDATLLSSVKHGKPVPEIGNGLETAFLSEMLKYAGPRSTQGEFSGGIGESQFASMLTDAYTEALSRKLDLGLTGNSRGES